MKPDEADVTPAPTREVVGDLLWICAQLLQELHRARLIDAEIRNGALCMADGNAEAAQKTLLRLFEADNERRNTLNALSDDLQALMQRFAGEPDART